MRLTQSYFSTYCKAMTTATARKTVETVEKGSRRKSNASTRFGASGVVNKGRPKGSRNKQTTIQLQAAREAFAPMAKMALDKGNAHLKKCKVEGCPACQWWGNVAFQYHFGKPTQPIEFDATALRGELESLAVAAGKTVEELEREAHEEGLLVMSRYRG